MAAAHPTIDAQVHAYERDHPGRPWAGTLAGPPEVTGDDMVRAMDEVGVDGALLVSPWTMYRYDASYVREVHAGHPGRFGLIRPFDHGAPDLEAQLEAWAATPGAVGARIVFLHGASAVADDPGIERILRAGKRHGLPINMLCWGQLGLFAQIARAHPDTCLVLDHLGIAQPFEPPVPGRPFAELDAVLDLAQLDNVVIKITGACTLSHEAFPYADIRAPVMRIIEAFGIERCLWGTDWTRATAFLTYEQGVEAFRLMDELSEAERGLLMGGNVSRVYGWSPFMTL